MLNANCCDFLLADTADKMETISYLLVANQMKENVLRRCYTRGDVRWRTMVDSVGISTKERVDLHITSNV